MRASVALVLLLPLVAGAQVQRTDEYLQRIDANGDGRVDLGEYQDWLSYAFDGMDRDRDGVLATHEQPGGKGAPITREQHRARLAERFRKQDVNRDGFLDAKELSTPPLMPISAFSMIKSPKDFFRSIARGGEKVKACSLQKIIFIITILSLFWRKMGVSRKK